MASYVTFFPNPENCVALSPPDRSCFELYISSAWQAAERRPTRELQPTTSVDLAVRWHCGALALRYVDQSFNPTARALERENEMARLW